MSLIRIPKNEYTVIDDVLSYVQSTDTVKIPLINIAGFDSNREVRMKVAEALKKCYATGEGFAMLEGTGISQDTIDTIFKTFRKFYQHPESEKKKFSMSFKDDLGYKIISRNADKSIIQEYTNIGLQLPDAVIKGHDNDPYYLSELGQCFFRHTDGPLSEEMSRRWPDHPDTPALKCSMEAYFVEMENLSVVLWQAFALALDLPIDYFVEKQRKHISHLQVNNYPEQTVKPPKGVMRIKKHFDINAFSILLNDEDGSEEASKGRLQVLTRENKWKNLPLQPGAFIVNIGELLHRWTNGTWKHVVHRVTNPVNKGKARITLGYFAFPDYDTPIVPFAVGGEPKYEPTTCGEHSRTGRRYAAKFYNRERMETLRKAQGLYEEGEREVDANVIQEQSSRSSRL